MSWQGSARPTQLSLIYERYTEHISRTMAVMKRCLTRGETMIETGCTQGNMSLMLAEIIEHVAHPRDIVSKALKWVHPGSVAAVLKRRRHSQRCIPRKLLISRVGVHEGGSEPLEGPRVAVVYPMPFGEEGIFGGGERYAHSLARALAERVPTRLVLFGRTRRRYFEGKLLIETYPWLTLLHGQRHNPLGFGFLRSLLAVDVIHCVVWHTMMTDMSILLARLSRKRVIVTDVGGGGSLSLLRWFDVGRMVDGFYVLSQFAAGFFARYGSKCRVIYGGVSIPPVPQAADPLDAGTPKILFVGRLLRHKGVDLLLQAAPMSVPVTIVGRPYDGEYFTYLQQLAVGKHVTFLTDADDARLNEELRTSTMLVHPAVYDGWGGGPHRRAGAFWAGRRRGNGTRSANHRVERR